MGCEVALYATTNWRRNKLHRILRYLRAKIGRYAAENGNKASLIILKMLNLKPFNTYSLMKTLNIIPAKKCSYTVYAKYLPFIIYYGSALLLFTRKVHCLQTFQHMSAHWALKV